MSQLSLFTSGAVLGPEFPLPLHAPFTTRRALVEGITRRTLSRLAEEGYLRRLLRGVYVASQVPDDVLLRAGALQLVVPPDAVVVDWTAEWLWTGVLPFGHHLEIPPVSMFLPPGRGRLRNSVCISGERTFMPGDLTTVGELKVTAPLRTAWDVGRFSHRDNAIAGLDALLRLGAFDLADLTGGVERFKRQRGVVQLRELAPRADGRAESGPESVLRLRWTDMIHLPPPEPQVPILDDRGVEIFRLDLGVAELRFAVEYDGEEFHSSDEDRKHDKDRREWIKRNHGWIIEPVRKENVFGPTRDIESILNKGVTRARRELGRRTGPWTRLS